MSHAPSRTSLVVATPAALAAYVASFDSGDEADVTSLGFTFVYDAASVTAVDNVTVVNGPGGVGRWLRGVAAVVQNDRNRLAQISKSLDPATGLATDASVATGSRGPLVVAPLGTGADDWPALIAAANANAYGRAVYMQAGTWHCNSRVDLVPGVHIIMAPGVSIVANLAFTGGHLNTPFNFDDWTPSGQDAAKITTTTADAAAGARVLSLTAAVGLSRGLSLGVGGATNQAAAYEVVGTYGAVVPNGTTPPAVTLSGVPVVDLNLRVECTSIAGGAARGQWTGRWSKDGGATWTAFTSGATVVLTGTGVTMAIAAGNAAINNVWTSSIGGTGPFIIGLDLPTLRAWPAATGIRRFQPGADIIIEGHGAQFSGQCDRMVSIVSALRARVSGLVMMSPNVDEYCCSFDTTSRLSDFLEIVGYNVPAALCAIEAAENCNMYFCHAIGASTDEAFLFQASYRCNNWGCSASSNVGSTTAFGICYGVSTDAVGCYECGSYGFSGSGLGDGIAIVGGSHDIDIVGAHISDCAAVHGTGTAILVQAAGGYSPGRVRISGASLKRNVMGLNLDGAQGVYASNIYTEAHTQQAIQLANGSELTMHGYECLERPGTVYAVKTNSATDRLAIDGFRMVTDVAPGTLTGYSFIVVANAARVRIRNGTFVYPAACVNGCGLSVNGGVASIENVDMVNGGIGAQQAGGTIRFGHGCDFTSTANGFNSDAGTFSFSPAAAVGKSTGV